MQASVHSLMKHVVSINAPEPSPHLTAILEKFSDDWLLNLAKRLQTTLRLEQLLEVFVDATHEVIPYDGLGYTHGSDAISIQHGTRGLHTCSYDLVLSENNLGRLDFSREIPFGDKDTRQLEFLVSHLVYPLRNALLYQQALTAAAQDPLTGALNRSALDNTLPREISLAQRHGNPLALLMLDLDEFKRINDQYGHITGDCVLKAFVERVAREMRLSDMIFRFGGEEFVVLLTNTGSNGATLLAERIRRGVESMDIGCDGLQLNATVSIGVAALGADPDPAHLLEQADKALYRSKAAGRNRVTTHQDR